MAFFNETDEPAPRCCDEPGCDAEGAYRAPKSRGNLRDYHWFCLDHVRVYNKSWNYCAGMSEAQIESEIRRSTTWERPTWPASVAARLAERLRETVYDNAGFYGYAASEEIGVKHKATPESKALNILGLPHDTPFKAAKARYRELVKRHHPDANGGDAAAEERLKKINQAFHTLKRAHEGDRVR